MVEETTPRARHVPLARTRHSGTLAGSLLRHARGSRNEKPAAALGTGRAQNDIVLVLYY
jgi:hypothetical protein